jgi:hypothetical protein
MLSVAKSSRRPSAVDRPDGRTLIDVERNQEFIQIAERQLADAEEAYRVDPSDANQRRIMRAWSAVRRARDEPEQGRD